MNNKAEGNQIQEEMDKAFELEINNLEIALINCNSRLLHNGVTNLIILLGDFKNPISLKNPNTKIVDVFLEYNNQKNYNQYNRDLQTVIINRLVQIATFKNEDENVQNVLENINKQSKALLG